MNNVVLIGRTVRQPELRYTPNGAAVCNFTLAVDRGMSKQQKQEAESKGYPTADFINIVVWGKQAESTANYLGKGKLVAVQGSIQTRSYEAKDGSRRYITEVVANRVKILEWENNNNHDYNDYDPDNYNDNDNYDEESDNIPF